MKRLLALSALIFGCSVSPQGTCTATSNNCVAPAVCKVDHDPPICVFPQGACYPRCANNASCINSVCVVQAPAVNSVSAPTTWSKRSQTVPVTAVIDGTGGPGIASATLQIAGQPDIAGTTTDSGLIRTYTFAVPGTVQAAFSETPVDFTIVASDTGGHTTPAAAQGHGQLLIDDVGPAVAGVTVNGGVAVAGIKWFKQGAGNIDAQVAISDAGSGVDPATLTLVSGGARIDAGTPTCTTGAAITCHFSVPQSAAIVPAGAQRLVSFTVAGADKAGNAVKTNIAALGIDGKAPAITFTIGATGTSKYPVNFADCNGGTVDATMYCGHNGSQFWRSGDSKYSLTFTVTDVYSAPDDKGSGVDNAGSTCTIAGSTATCTVSYDTATSTFNFPANFAGATFTSNSEGNGTVSVSVTAKDAVGNVATSAPVTVNVTRVKWMRSMAGKIDTIKGSPVVTTKPAPQIIVNGSERDTAGPLASLKPDGSILWRAGHGDAVAVSNNVAYSSATSTLYVLGDSATKLFAYTVSSTNAAAAYNCPLQLATTGTSVGAPALIASGGAEYALVSDSGLKRLWAFTGGSGNCSLGSTSTSNGGAWTGIVNPPTTDGSKVYVPNNGTKLSTVAFAAGAFGAVTDAASFSVPIFGPVDIADALYFGDRNATPSAHSYSSTALTLNWNSSALNDALSAGVVVDGTNVFATPSTLDGKLHAFAKATGAPSFTWPTTSATIGNISAPSFGADNTIYFTDDGNHEFVPLHVTASTPALAANWTATYQGSSTGTNPDTTLDSVSTEPTLDASGVAYFGTLAGKVYAVITDSAGPLAPAAGSTWPRVGYDNCNSSNTAFTCQ